MPSNATIVLLGHAGRDAELRTIQDGKKVASFSMVVNDTKDHATWFEVSVWGNTAEKYVGPFLKKGNLVHVIGDLKLETYQKKDGTTGSKISVRANSVDICSGKDKAAEKIDHQAPLSPAPDSISSMDQSDIPF